jgi:plasmid stabilization system protein ParE
MTFTVVVTDQAANDLSENVEWWSRERSEEQALRWHQGIHTAIESLAEQPERFPLAAEHDEFPYLLREMHFGLGSRPSHRILFTVAKKAVIVLTVRHASRDAVRRDDLPSV